MTSKIIYANFSSLKLCREHEETLQDNISHIYDDVFEEDGGFLIWCVVSPNSYNFYI